MSESLKNSQQFGYVYKNGKSFANKYLVMYVCKNELSVNRLGISVSKKVGNSVVRHRISRLIRESYRLNDSISNSGLDIVIVARAGSKGKNYSEISSALMHLVKLHKIVKSSEPDRN
ncbi:MAG TPA: ribonuclease P protein component [Lachnoclostridium phytofermentans]|uniref:Ribonuclease P protein component n=1 Tax=Lachnoclostridium phytofermentans TaxID=66219 RepID=A0A3D2X6G0_9FIRM|nr:ribonuclease P protein component [Lachnoclostridium sp.]HCL01918.1 ribonuclease P protein component [Lachnoclostridium phytofermentans]